jgi:hypothetical protein
MPLLKLDGTPLDRTLVRAVMLFPSDELLRERFVAVQKARALIQDCAESERVVLSALDVHLLIDSPRCGNSGEFDTLIDESIKKATVAGDILACLYLMNRFKMPEPSMNKAIFVAMDYAKTARYGDGSDLLTSEARIRESWKEYRSVSHFWAMFRIDIAYRLGETGRALDPENHQKFLECSKEIYKFGSTFVPHRARPQKPILDPAECWQLPSEISAFAPPCVSKSETKPEKLISTLEKYQAPKRKD